MNWDKALIITKYIVVLIVEVAYIFSAVITMSALGGAVMAITGNLVYSISVAFWTLVITVTAQRFMREKLLTFLFPPQTE